MGTTLEIQHTCTSSCERDTYRQLSSPRTLLHWHRAQTTTTANATRPREPLPWHGGYLSRTDETKTRRKIRKELRSYKVTTFTSNESFTVVLLSILARQWYTSETGLFGNFFRGFKSAPPGLSCMVRWTHRKSNLAHNQWLANHRS